MEEFDRPHPGEFELTVRGHMPLSPSEHQIQLRRAVIASTIGTAIEWCDFFLYSTVTGLASHEKAQTK